MRNSHVVVVTTAVLLAVNGYAASATTRDSRLEAPSDVAMSAFNSDPERQFDFFLGEWDGSVGNGRGADSSAEVRYFVYSILQGTATLDLWATRGRSGVGIRHYDRDRRLWVEWNLEATGGRTGTSVYHGMFRHGRAVLVSGDRRRAGAMPVLAHTFADITPFSVRWTASQLNSDQAVETTSEVRELVRTAVEARSPMLRVFRPPTADEVSCGDPGFRRYDVLVGKWAGPDETLEFAPALDGCATIGVLRTSSGQREVIILTYDPGRQSWITTVLSADPTARLKMYRGDTAWYDLVGENGGAATWLVSGKDLRLTGTLLQYRRDGKKVELHRSEDQN